jgi:hypothetical protein
MVNWRLCCACTLLLPQIAGTSVTGPTTANPFDVLRPCVAIDARDIARLDAGNTVARVLSEQDGNVAVFGARRVAVTGDRLVAWMQRIEQLRQSKFVESMARFSDPPVFEDLALLSLDERDLQILRECLSAKCRAKLTDREIQTLRQATNSADLQWGPRLDDAFRRLILERLRAYLSGGHRALGQWVDGRSPMPLDAVFGSLLTRTPCLGQQFTELADLLERFPDPVDTPLDTFFYWSKERLGGKSIVSATQVVVARGQDARSTDALVVGKQLFATHYMNGSLNVTAIVSTGKGSAQYLVILNRTNVDFLRGLFGGLVRLTVERRIKAELPSILDQLAKRLESEPPR